MFISGIDMTIVNVALPDISRDLGAGINDLQWVLDGFLVALGALLLLGSGLADHFGRRRVFLVSFGLFAAASVLAARSRTPIELIGARVLMGAAIAGIMPPALSLIAVMFPPEERARAIGIWATVAGLAIAVGPVLGGFLVSGFGWPSVFLVNVPVAVLAIPAGLLLLPESTRPGAPPLDLIGVSLSTVGLGGVIFALIEGPSGGWTKPAVVVAVLAGVGGLAAFVAVERRRDHPLFDLGVLGRRRVFAGAAAIFALYAAFLALMFLLPQYLQYVQDRSTTVAGLALLPLGIGVMATAPLSGAIAARVGARTMVVIGLLGMAAAAALLLPIGPRTSLLHVFVALGLYGASFSVTIATATTVIMNDLGTEKAGDAAAVNQLARQVSGAAGVALVGSVFGAVYRSSVQDAVGALPSEVQSLARDSIEGAAQVAAGLSGGLSRDLLTHADASFDVAAHAGVWLCVAMLLIAAAIAFRGLAAEARP
jgi:EmrB/QacA subfamily drug resistance transporter